MDSERRLADHTVVIEDGFITEIVPSAAFRGPAKTIDCTGLFVMPGLADLYTHYWDPLDAPLYLGAGITTIRTVSTPFQLALGRVAARGEFPSPRMVNISPPIDGVGANGRTDMPRGVALTEPQQAEALVRRFAGAGYHQVKAFSLLTPQNFLALAQACRTAGIRVSANCPNAMTFEEAIDAGAYCFDQLHNIARGHLRAGTAEPAFWDRFDPVPGTKMDPVKIRALARRLADARVWNVPTLVFHQRDGVPPPEGLKDPELRYVSSSAVKDWESTLVRWTRRARMDDVGKWRAAARERAERFLEAVAILHEEGTPLLTGTDSLNPWNVQGKSLHAELANFVAAGMSPYQALRCATSEAARFLGEDDVAGTVAAGKRADLVLTRSDPLKGIDAFQGIEAVCVNGYYLTRKDLDGMLAQRAALASAPPSIPATHFSADERTWRERIVGAEAGRISFRHTRQDDGGWLIEERHASALPRRHVDRRTTRLLLDRDFKVRSCEYRVDSFAGAESGTITRTADGYALQAREIDGWESRSTLQCDPLLPSERLTATLWPLLFSEKKAAEGPALDVEGGALESRPLRFTDGKLAVTRPTHATEQHYRFDAGGAFAGMEETMPLLWLRELAP